MIQHLVTLVRIIQCSADIMRDYQCLFDQCCHQVFDLISHVLTLTPYLPIS
jgi:hypothetical protein